MNKPAKRSKSFDKDREFAVILESLRSDFKIFGEDLMSVKEDVEALKEDVRVLKEDVSILKTDVHIIKGRLTSLEFKVDVIGKELSAQRKDIVEIKAIIPNHDKRITALEIAATK